MLTETTTQDTTQDATRNTMQANGQADTRAALSGHGVRCRTAQFRSSPRNARSARRFAVRCLEEWGHPPRSETSRTVALLVGELAANAVRHGRVPGRDFALRLTSDDRTGLLRVEVADACQDHPPTATVCPSPEDESGRGLFLVDALAARWGTARREPLGKTVWAEVPG